MAIINSAWQQGVLFLACCALLLRQSVSLRDVPSEHEAHQKPGLPWGWGRLARGLHEVFEGDYHDPDELDETPKLGRGITKLGIHGEGWSHIAHNLLESDSEVMALAAALKKGRATGPQPAEGLNLDNFKQFPEGDDEDGEEDSDGNIDEEEDPVVDEQDQGQILQAAGLVEGEEAKKEGESSGLAAAAPAKAAAAERDRNARPPWFSQRMLTADARKEPHGPRAKGSGRRQRHHNTAEDTWLTCHRQFVKDLDEWDKQGGWDVLFYGDSIIEEWQGTFLGAPWGPFHDVRKVWDEFFGRKPYRAHSMGIASDGVEQLLWRIQHGELPSQGQHHPKVVVVHVGTNDIAGECTVETGQKVADQMQTLLDEFHQHLPSTHIVVMAILPKGEVWPNRCSEAIDEANTRVQGLTEGSDHLHFLDIGQAFLSETLDGDRFEIKETLMPDSMHPSAVGMRIIATRLEPMVSQLVASAKDMPQESR